MGNSKPGIAYLKNGNGIDKFEIEVFYEKNLLQASQYGEVVGAYKVMVDFKLGQWETTSATLVPQFLYM